MVPACAPGSAGVWIGMIIEDSPSNSGRLVVMAVVSWLVGAAVIAGGSYVRTRLLRANE
jgi:hypothetical protein